MKMLKMKFFLMLGIVAMLASCSQNEEVLQTGNDGAKVRVTFNLKTENLPQTRAGVVGLTRYCIEVYAGTDTQVDPIFSDYNNADGQFEIFIDKEVTNATILFWADYGEKYYDVTGGLKQITMNADAANAPDEKSEAFFSKMANYAFPADASQPIDVVLKRAVAQVVLTETNGLEANKTLAATFDHYPQFSVVEEMPTGTKTSRTVSLAIASAITQGEIGHFCIFAPKGEKHLETFTFTYEGQTRQLANVPLQANYKTNITGKFDPRVEQQFKITSDDGWETPDHNGSWLKVGDAYTHIALDGKQYECIVLSAKYTKAAVIYKNRLPNRTIIGNTTALNYSDALTQCEGLGGRFPTEAEFRFLWNTNLSDAEKDSNYFVAGNQCMAFASNLDKLTIAAATSTGKYFCVFEIPNPNI